LVVKINIPEENAAGVNHFVLPFRQWIERTAAIGLNAGTGKYGGDTYP